MQLEKFHIFQNSCAISLHFLAVGTGIHSDYIVKIIAFVTSKTIDFTVECPSRKLYEMVFIESPVAIYLESTYGN